MHAQFRGIESEAEARRALEEIERLIADAAVSGVRLDPWMGELADELRAVIPQLDAEAAAKIAAGMAKNPRGSLAAQGRLLPGTLRALRG